MYCPLYLSPKNNFLFLVIISIWWLSTQCYYRLAIIDVVFSKKDKIFYSPETLLLAIYCVLASSLKMSRFLHNRSKFLLPNLTVFPEIRIVTKKKNTTFLQLLMITFHLRASKYFIYKC